MNVWALPLLYGPDTISSGEIVPLLNKQNRPEQQLAPYCEFQQC